MIRLARRLAWLAALFCGTVPLAGQTPSPRGSTPDLLIRGGEVIDGSGAPARRLDVRVSGDLIVQVAPDLAPRPGERVLDASGLVVSPGFIDLHSHADRSIDEMPSAESQVRQGITTAVVGQDGGSALPVAPFLEGIDRLHPAINFATMVGHGTVRNTVLGGDFRRAATPEEIRTMAALVDRAMRDGAVGLSSGTEYDPGFFAEPAELEVLARAVKPFGGFYASHVRDEENTVLDAWREVIELGRKTGVPVHISHVKLASKPVWGKASEALALIDRAAEQGVRVTADWYPYTFWSSSIYVLIPDRDWENRGKWETGLDEIGGPQNVLITGYRPDSALNGKTIQQIAQARGQDAVATVIEMIREAGPGIGIMATAMDERDLDLLAAHPRVMVCSDGSLRGSHPRGYGAFPRVLGTYVREKGVISLPQAIVKMASGPAQILGFTDRGTIAQGKKADLVLFDPRTVADRGTKVQPAQAPVGIQYVVVNGELVLDDGALTAARPGRGLRRANWTPYNTSAGQ